MPIGGMRAADMKRPEGTLMIKVTLPGLHDPKTEGGTIHEVVAGAHVFRLRREDPSILAGYHGFPGGATQRAAVDVRSLAPQETVRLILTWTPESLTLYAGSPNDPTSVVQGEGVKSATQLRVDRRGGVYELDSAVVHGPTVHSGGTELLGPPALELWTTTMEVVRLLLLAESSDDGYMVEVALAQAALSAMVTGLETYCQTRFVELDGEGIPINAQGSCAIRNQGGAGCAKGRPSAGGGDSP